jgi:hypothetical protein
LLTPNGTSADEKLKFPCGVVTSNFTGEAEAPTFTITPFSCTGPGGVSEGVTRVLIFQLVVPLMASVPSNRQPRRISTGAPVTAIDPSQLVAAVSPTPRIKRNDCAGATVVVAAWMETAGERNRRHSRTAPAAITTRTVVLKAARILMRLPLTALLALVIRRLGSHLQLFVDLVQQVLGLLGVPLHVPLVGFLRGDNLLPGLLAEPLSCCQVGVPAAGNVLLRRLGKGQPYHQKQDAGKFQK